MTNEIFLNTAYAIALSVESDKHHKRAEELANHMEDEAIRLVTTQAVLLEIGNALSKKRYHCNRVLSQIASRLVTGSAIMRMVNCGIKVSTKVAKRLVNGRPMTRLG